MKNKTLYITDLDGTLLNDKGKLNYFSVNIINNLIDKGLLLTVATGRTLFFSLSVLSPLNLNLPIAVLNGSIIWDIKNNKCINTNSLCLFDIHKIHKQKDDNIAAAWLYVSDTNTAEILIEYGNEKIMIDYFNDSGDKFENVASFDEISKKKIIYVMFLSDSYDRLSYINTKLSKITTLKTDLFHDIYKDGLYCLDIFSAKSSKAFCVKYFNEILQPEKIISFGDSNNDIDMFKSSDFSYCTLNGDIAAKNSSTEIIGNCSNDAVARFLEKHFNA